MENSENYAEKAETTKPLSASSVKYSIDSILGRTDKKETQDLPATVTCK